MINEFNKKQIENQNNKENKENSNIFDEKEISINTEKDKNKNNEINIMFVYENKQMEEKNHEKNYSESKQIFNKESNNLESDSDKNNNNISDEINFNRIRIIDENEFQLFLVNLTGIQRTIRIILLIICIILVLLLIILYFIYFINNILIKYKKVLILGLFLVILFFIIFILIVYLYRVLGKPKIKYNPLNNKLEIKTKLLFNFDDYEINDINEIKIKNKEKVCGINNYIYNYELIIFFKDNQKKKIFELYDGTHDGREVKMIQNYFFKFLITHQYKNNYKTNNN